jgi:hypothetical protein
MDLVARVDEVGDPVDGDGAVPVGDEQESHP